MFGKSRNRPLPAGCPRADCDPPTPDRRQSDRTPVDVTILCRAGRAGLPPTEVRVRDVSRTGLSFRIDRPLPPGAMLTLDLPSEHGPPAAVLACARHCNRDPAGDWVVGCTFAAELGDGDLTAFGIRASEAPIGDQRRWARAAPTAGRAIVRRFGNGLSGPAPAQILNLSPGGVGLIIDARVEPGTLLDLELMGGSDRPGLTILASVVFVAPHEPGEWLLGCTFVRDLSDSDFRSLR